MAKQRKSIFDTQTSEKDIKSAAKEVQEKSIDKIPEKREVIEKTKPKTKPKSKKKDEKLMHLYVHETPHTTAKLNAIKRGKKLGEYIEWLINNDKV
jgi:hypothetical protein